MFNLQGSEIIFILLLALVVLGPEKLPAAVKKFTQTYNEVKKMGTGFQTELKSALDEPMREMRETANLIKDSADPAKMMADAESSAATSLAAERDAERQMRAQEIIEQRKSKTTGATPADSNADSNADSGAAATADIDEPNDEWGDPVDADHVAGDHEAADTADLPAEQPKNDPFGRPGVRSSAGPTRVNGAAPGADDAAPDDAALDDAAVDDSALDTADEQASA